MTLKQRAALYHQYATLIASGLHLDRSTQLLLEQRPAAEVRRFLQGVLRGLDQRLSFSDAIATHNAGNVSFLETSLLRAGERGGRLEVACEHLASYFELRQKSISKVIGAMIYPLILLHLGLLFPSVIKAFTGVPIPSIIGETILRLGITWVILGGLVVAWRSGSKMVAESTAVNSLVNTLPLIGGINKHWALARFCQVFQTCLLAGINMTESLQLAGEASQSALLTKAGKKAAKGITNGLTLTDAMKGTGAFPITFIHSIHTAETTGGLDIEMGRWGIAEAELAAMAQDRAAEWLPRIFYFIVVLYVAAQIIGLFQGIYGKDGMLQQLLNEY